MISQVQLWLNPSVSEISRSSGPVEDQNARKPTLLSCKLRQFKHLIFNLACGLRAFSVVGPSAWNDLPVELRSLLMTCPSKFYISLKSFFFGHDWTGSASE